MKSNQIKVEFVEADNLDELRETTNKAIQAIQVNVRNIIKDVNLTHKPIGGYVVQITYEEVKYDEDKIILNESEEVNDVK